MQSKEPKIIKGGHKPTLLLIELKHRIFEMEGDVFFPRSGTVDAALKDMKGSIGQLDAIDNESTDELLQI